MIVTFEGENAFLSNFEESPFEVAGIKYPTVEHWFQAWKTTDLEIHKAIAAAPTPGKAKRMGRKVDLRPDWEQIKIEVMRAGLRYKFENPELRAKLLATGNEPLMEGNTWHDNTWGNCFCPKCIGIHGQNLLGALLMETREKIRVE